MKNSNTNSAAVPGRVIVLRWRSTCARCGGRLEVGERARIGDCGTMLHVVTCSKLSRLPHRAFARRIGGRT